MKDKELFKLSDDQLELVCNKEWILSKLRIIDSVYLLFGKIAKGMQGSLQSLQGTLPDEAYQNIPKISKGENYQSLPYVMLDYPRFFSKESTLAIRTLFWWGNFFSINLHLAGTCKERAVPVIKAKFVELQTKGYAVCVHTDPWHHHFEKDNYVQMDELTEIEFYKILEGADFENCKTIAFAAMGFGCRLLRSPFR